MKVLKVKSDVVDKIQLLQTQYQTNEDVLNAFIERNQLGNGDILDSLIYTKLVEKCSESKIKFENAKRELIDPLLPEGCQEWNLDFLNEELTCTLEEDVKGTCKCCKS